MSPNGFPSVNCGFHDSAAVPDRTAIQIIAQVKRFFRSCEVTDQIREMEGKLLLSPHRVAPLVQKAVF